MKILYLLTRDPDDTSTTFINIHGKEHDVHVLDIRNNADYPGIIELIEKSDKVVSW